MMGSRKKLFLAALLGALMVLCFAIGLVPARMQADMRANAASGAAAVAISADGANPVGDSYSIPVGADQSFSALGQASDGGIELLPAGAVEWSLASGGEAALSVANGDLVATVSALAPGDAGLYVATGDGLVDMVNLDLYQLAAGGKVVTSLEITSPVDGSQVFVQTGVTGVPMVVTSAVDDPSDIGQVDYTYDAKATASATQPPYGILIPDVTALTSFGITAAAQSYSNYQNFQDSITFSVVTGNFDADGDGLPDDPFGIGFGAGDRFVSNVGGVQTSLVGLQTASKVIDIPLGGATASVTDPNNPSRIVTVVVPAGLVQAGENGILFLSAADDLNTLLGATEAADVAATPAGGLVPGGRFAEVSILISTDGGATFSEIDPARLAETPVTVFMDGLTIVPGDNARIFDYPSDVIDTDATAGVDIAIDAAVGQAWIPTSNGTSIAAGQMSAQLTSLSIVAPFATPGHMQVVSISDPFDFATGGKQVDVTLSNASILDDIDVEIAGQAAAAKSIDAKGVNIVVTVTVPEAPALDSPQSSDAVDVSVTNNTAGQFDVLVNGFTYEGPQVLSVTPDSGPETGGTDVVVEADGVGGILESVTIGGSVINLANKASFIYGQTTSASAGPADVVVTLTNNYTGTLDDGYTYTEAPPVVTSVFPDAVFNDGGYTVAVNGSFFRDPQAKAAGLNYVLFTVAQDQYDPSTDASAAAVEFIDDTRLNALTPIYAGAGQYNLYVATSTYGQKADSFLISNLVDFTFLDIAAAQMEIYDIEPRHGDLAGGQRVLISGDGFPTSDIVGKVAAGGIDALGRAKGTLTGNVLQIADTFAAQGTTNHQVPVSLFREPVGSGTQAPASIDTDITFDSNILTGVGFAPSTNLLTFYSKTASTNTTVAGVIGLVISGGTFEITTVDDQRLGNTGVSENPFLLGNLFFNVVGTTDGDSTAISATALSMATAGATAITNAVADDGLFTVGCAVLTAQDVFPDFDDDSSGGVDFTEYQTNLPCGTQAAFDELDLNDDTVINADDFILTPPSCDEIVAGADADTSGDVTFVEYQAFFSQATQEQFDAIAGQDGVITEDDCAVFGPAKVDVFFGPNQADVIAVVQATKAYGNYTNGVIRVTSPAGERPGNVDVRVVLKADPSIIAISRATSIYSPAVVKVSRPGDGGFVYDEFSVSSVDPDRTWVYGGETVAINGVGFDPEIALVTIGGQVAPLDSTQIQSSTTLYVIVPTLAAANGDPATTTVDVHAENQGTGKSDTLEDGFTYVRYSADVVTEGLATGTVFTTAFSFDNSTNLDTQEIVLNSTGSVTGQLFVPSFSTQTIKGALKAAKPLGSVFGLARATKVPDLFALQSLVGDAAPNIWNFDLHLYRGEAPYDELQITLSTKEVPIKLSYPVDDVVPAITTTTLGGGLVSTWSNESDQDRHYAARAAGFTGTPDSGDFQSQLLPDEFTEGGGGNVVSIDNSRIYSLGTAYALRLNAGPGPISADFIDNQETEVNPGDTITCTGTGLGYADIDILDGSDAAKAVVPVTTILTQDEYGVSFVLPQGVAPGDIIVRLKVPVPGGVQNVDLLGLVVPGGGIDIGPFLALLLALLGILAGGDGGDDGGTCFIATAAYGTPMAGQIDTLRAVRDEFMFSNPVGTAFVDLYYSVSPAIADVVAQNPVLAAIVRVVLTPVILLGKVVLAMPNVSLMLTFGLVTLAVYRRKLRRSKRA
jgi:hypothetical protein